MRKFADRVVLILNIVAAVSLLMAYAAPYVNPARFMLPALFGLGYPFLLLANLAFLGYWLIQWKKEILLPLLVILLGWNHLNNLLPLHFRQKAPSDPAGNERMISVLSYNVRGFNVYNWSSEPRIREKILDFVREKDPDILCFQEYYTSDRPGETHAELSRSLKMLPENAAYFPTDQANRQGFGIVTFSKHKIIRHSRIPFNTSVNAAMYTDLQIGSDTLRVFNVHLQSIRFRQEDYAFMDTVSLKYSNQQMRGIRNIGHQLKAAFTMRAEQADMIASYIRESPYPVMVIGDFNDTPQSFTYRKIKRGMHDAFRVSGRGFGNTYAGDLPSFRIDYILFSDPIRSIQFTRAREPYSDHYPITASLYLADQDKSE